MVIYTHPVTGLLYRKYGASSFVVCNSKGEPRWQCSTSMQYSGMKKGFVKYMEWSGRKPLTTQNSNFKRSKFSGQ